MRPVPVTNEVKCEVIVNLFEEHPETLAANITRHMLQLLFLVVFNSPCNATGV